MNHRVLVLGAVSRAGMAASTALGLRGATLTLVDDDLAAADRLVEALREYGCAAAVDPVSPDDTHAVCALARDHAIVVDATMSVDGGHSAGVMVSGAGLEGQAYVCIRRADMPLPAADRRGFRAFVDLTFEPSVDEESDSLHSLIEAIAGAVCDLRLAGEISVHASP